MAGLRSIFIIVGRHDSFRIRNRLVRSHGGTIVHGRTAPEFTIRIKEAPREMIDNNLPRVGCLALLRQQHSHALVVEIQL